MVRGSVELDVLSRVSDARCDSMIVQGVTFQKYGRTVWVKDQMRMPKTSNPMIANTLKNSVPATLEAKDCSAG
jgi:hypothetical protein